MVKNLRLVCSVGDGSSPGLGSPLEKGMTTHSSSLPWRIPRTEEPGGLQTWGHKKSDKTELLTLSLSYLNTCQLN